MSLSKIFADYVIKTKYESLPKEVVDITISCIYNYMGCAYAGSAEAPAITLQQMRRSFFSDGKCSVIGTDLTTDPATAALLNGTAGNSLGYDDMYREGIYHPGVPIISCALAISELMPITGKEFITAVVLGYEISNRLAYMMQPSHYKYFHTTATAGTYGAVIAACKLLKLNENEIISALGAAGTQAAGLQECTGNMNQRMHLGSAARNGVLGGLMAKSGFLSAPNILDGPAGYINAMSDFRDDPKTWFADLGKKYLILETMFKFYPCCAHIHSCIDAVIGAVEKHDIKPEEIEKIVVGTYKTAINNSGNPNPTDIQKAKFSIEYCIATAAIKRCLTMQEFALWPPNKDILDMMEKVQLDVDSELEAAFHKGMQGGKVTVLSTKGTFTENRPYRKGDPEAPLTKQEVIEKYRSLCQMVISKESTKKLEEIIERLTELKDVSVLAKSYK